MGDYMSMRFKGTIKPEYRSAIEEVNDDGFWEALGVATSIGYDTLNRYTFIPCGQLSYPPVEWEDESSEYYVRSFNEDTGEWIFQCSIKSSGEHDLEYDKEIKMFMNEIVPVICEKVDNFELWHEFWSNPDKYAYTLDENTNKLRCEKIENTIANKDGSWRVMDGINGKVKINVSYERD